MLRLPLIVNVIVNSNIGIVDFCHPHAIGVPGTGIGYRSQFVLPTTGVGILPIGVAALEFHDVTFRRPAVGTG